MESKTKTIIFRTSGDASTLYSELFHLEDIGELKIKRWSNVTFNNENQLWEVTLCSDPKNVLYRDTKRSACIEWEHKYWENKGVDEY